MLPDPSNNEHRNESGQEQQPPNTTENKAQFAAMWHEILQVGGERSRIVEVLPRGEPDATCDVAEEGGKKEPDRYSVKVGHATAPHSGNRKVIDPYAEAEVRQQKGEQCQQGEPIYPLHARRPWTAN